MSTDFEIVDRPLRKPGKAAELAEKAMSLPEGKAILIGLEKTYSIRMNASRHARSKGYKFCQTKCPDGYYVWAVRRNGNSQ